MPSQDDDDTETRTLLSWRAEFSRAALKSSRVPINCIEKGVWHLWTTWPRPSVLKDEDHAISWWWHAFVNSSASVLLYVESPVKSASLIDTVANTIPRTIETRRWQFYSPSWWREDTSWQHGRRNDGSRKSPGDSLHDSKSILEHRVRHLLKRSASIAPLGPRSVRQLLQDAHMRKNKASRLPTLRWTKPLTRQTRRMQEAGSRGTATTLLQRIQQWREWESKDFRTSQSDAEPDNIKSWRGPDPRDRVLPRMNISKTSDRDKIQNASGAIPQLCGRWKIGARRGRRGRHDNRVIPKHELQSRPTCERRRSASGTSLLPSSVRKAGWTKTRSIVEGCEGLEKEDSDKNKTTTTRMIWSGVCLEMVKNRNSLILIHVLMMIVTYCRSRNRCERTWSDQCALRQAIGHCSSILSNETCQVKHEATTTQSTWEIKSILDSAKCQQSWRPVVPRKGFSSIDTKTSSKSFEEQHAYWTDIVILKRHWTKRDYTAPYWRSKKRWRWKSDSIVRYENLKDWLRFSPISTKVN